MKALTCRITGQTITLGRQMAKSGEGTVWETDRSGLLAKLYHSPDPERVSKLEVMLAYPPQDATFKQRHPTLAWPQDLLEDDQGRCVGFLMPLIPRSVKLSTIYNPRLRSRKAPRFNWYYLHATALNVASVLQSLHRDGYVVGDLKPQNLLVNRQAMVAVIDTDSFQVCHPTTGQRFRCLVGSEGFTPVELLGQALADLDQTEVHDRFRLGVMIHLLLFGDHPFKGRWVGGGESPNPTDLIRQGFWPYAPNSLIQPGPSTIPLDIIHPALQSCFHQCFTAGHQQPEARPTAQAWYLALRTAIADLQLCPQEPNHYYSRSYGHCYWCDRSKALGIDIFSPVGLTTSKTLPPSSSPLPQGQRSLSYTSIAYSRQQGRRARTHSTWNAQPRRGHLRWLRLSAAQIGALLCLLSSLGMGLLLWPDLSSQVTSKSRSSPWHPLSQLLPQSAAAPTSDLSLSGGQTEAPLVQGHWDKVTAVTISPDGTLLATGSWDTTIKLWQFKTGRLLKTLYGHANRVADLAIADRGKVLVSSSIEGEIIQWQLPSGQPLRTLAGHLERELPAFGRAVAVTPNGQRLVRNSWGGTIVLQNLSTGKVERTFSGYLFSQMAMTISSNGQRLASSSAEGKIKVWDLATGQLIRSLPESWEWETTDLPRSLLFTPNGKTLVSGGWGGLISLWNLETGELLRSLAGHQEGVYALAIGPKGHLLASGGRDRKIYLWQLQTGQLLRRLNGHQGSILSLAISPDGQFLVSGSEDKTVKIWQLPSGRLLRTLAEP